MNNPGFIISGNRENPYHFSVGALVIHDNKIAIIKKSTNIYTLPRETAYSTESLFDVLNRGLREELGVTVKILNYIGSIIENFTYFDGTKIEKTTAYFNCIKIKDLPKEQEINELDDEILWVEKKAAVSLLRKSNNREFKIVKRLK